MTLDCGDLVVEDAGSLGVNVLSKNNRRQICFFNAKGAEALRQWLGQRALGDESKSTEAVLREASGLFHQILSAIAARRLLESHKLPQTMRDAFAARLLEPEAIERICADGFETCVRALAALGAKDVTIHECSPTEEER